jgi:6-pyruvoyltetrahydropterin/6-carboxytetrahydropterin synthase
MIVDAARPRHGGDTLARMFEVQKSASFSAAHALRDYEGPCARNHGHNYRVEVVVRSDRLDARLMVIDFDDLQRLLAPLVERVDHRDLNALTPFDRVNPTAEAIARWFFQELRPAVAESTEGRAHLALVRLWETPDSCVVYTEDSGPAPPR